ncbi:MAG: helix-turn-helix domain-containing protein [Akkermansiaceae bacterium]
MKRKTVGLVLDFFNPEVLDGARAYFDEHDIKLDARWSVRGDWTPAKPSWDGLIYGVVDDAELFSRVQGWEMPKISLTAKNPKGWEVEPDYFRCGVLAAQAVLEGGADSIYNLAVSGREVDSEFSLGVIHYAQENDVLCRTHVMSHFKMAYILREVRTEISQMPVTLGLCSPHAGLAYSLQEEILQSRLRIPEDVSMAVIDKDIQRTPSLATVPLTTVDLDEWHRGFVAAEMMHHVLEGDPPKQKTIVIPPKGITRRASTGHVAVEDRIAAMALSFVRKNYLQPIGVLDVVQAVGASRRVVEMRFKKTLNRGIHEEITRLRIEEAKHQITNQWPTITAVANSCGFSSIHYFSAAFKRETGLSPKQYQMREKAKV